MTTEHAAPPRHARLRALSAAASAMYDDLRAAASASGWLSKAQFWRVLARHGMLASASLIAADLLTVALDGTAGVTSPETLDQADALARGIVP